MTGIPLWDRHNIDWVPTLNLGHSKSVKRREQNEALIGEVKGKAKTTGGIARIRTFTEATEIKRAWSPPCRLCF